MARRRQYLGQPAVDTKFLEEMMEVWHSLAKQAEKHEGTKKGYAYSTAQDLIQYLYCQFHQKISNQYYQHQELQLRLLMLAKMNRKLFGLMN